MKVLPTLFIVLALCASQATRSQSFKEDFYKAHVFIDYEMYDLALPAFLELNRNYPGNTNIRGIIGYLYLQTPDQKHKSLDYLANCKSELSAYYKFGNHKESGTPLESIWFLGKAYYENKQYDKAIALFQEYKDTLRNGNKKDRMIIEEDIRQSQIAKKNTKSS